VGGRERAWSGVQLLLEKGADVEARDYREITALHWAVGNGHGGVVRLLLE
jgi:ankyrin repeat protein